MAILSRRFEEVGFTLIELMVVVLIIGILLAIAVPYAFERSELAAAEPSLDWGASDGAEVIAADGPQKIAWTNDTTSMTLVSKSKPGICFWVREDIVLGTTFSRATTTDGCDPTAMGGTPISSSSAWDD